MACPVGWCLNALGWRVLYHEHDSPQPDAAQTRFVRFILTRRHQLARRADLCVVPNARRARHFQEATGTTRPVLTVMNCPQREEAAMTKEGGEGARQFVVFYHGSIVPARLSFAVIEAIRRLPARVVLRVAGYETIGHPEYVAALQAEAARLGMKDRVEYIGALPLRADLLAQCRRADVGLALMPPGSKDINEQTMAGASNKPFDYLACGVPILVSDLPDWNEMFVATRLGRACDPRDPESLARALNWFLEHPVEARQMGARGRQRVRREWNYETQFAPVMARLNSAD